MLFVTFRRGYISRKSWRSHNALYVHYGNFHFCRPTCEMSVQSPKHGVSSTTEPWTVLGRRFRVLWIDCVIQPAAHWLFPQVEELVNSCWQKGKKKCIAICVVMSEAQLTQKSLSNQAAFCWSICREMTEFSPNMVNVTGPLFSVILRTDHCSLFSLFTSYLSSNLWFVQP